MQQQEHPNQTHLTGVWGDHPLRIYSVSSLCWTGERKVYCRPSVAVRSGRFPLILHSRI